MRVKRYQYDGIPFVSIVDDTDCPVDPYVSCYLTSIRISKSTNSTVRYANELLFVLNHFAGRNIRLAKRVASCDFISFSEYTHFYEQCFFQKAQLDKNYSFIVPHIDNKHLRNSMIANARVGARVSSETIQGRVRRFRLFLEWLFNEFHFDNHSDETLDKFQKLIANIKLDEQAFGRNRSQKVSNPEESVIPNNVFRHMLEIILPTSPCNPFKSSKIRNYLIISLLMQSGIRRGAVAKLKISDCHFHGSYDRISIYRSGNDASDPRLEKPNQKTKAHLATVDRTLMEQLKFYVDHYRARFLPSQTHDYVFVSEKNSKGTIGLPLSLKALNAIFYVLSEALGFHIHPHLLRHKWNEIFDEEGDRKGVDPLLLEDIRKYAMGWSQHSTMAQLYNEKRLAQKTRELSKAHQRKVDL